MLWSLGFSLSSLQQTSTRANSVLSSHGSCSLFASRQKNELNSSSVECVMKPMPMPMNCYEELSVFIFPLLSSTTKHNIRESDSQQVLVMEVYSTLTITKLYWNRILDSYERLQTDSQDIKQNICISEHALSRHHRQSATYSFSAHYHFITFNDQLMLRGV